ncbi:MAG: 50S ribosome-binding GTPase [Methylococcales bacterium]|nr:50S ribosome-binding GTPase [Methylococcales bacterium]
MDILTRWTWKRLGQALFNPKPGGIESKIEEIKQSLPIPVFWLLGKTQSGKTSLIRELTGDNAAEIGNGFIACTKTSRFYDFPSPSHPIMRFLDTRGLGETAYNPTEDLAWCAGQAHLLVVVLRALDMNQAEIVAAVLAIHKKHPEWPIVVVQTALHEGYPTLETGHILPYPYQFSPFPPQVPHALAQVLLHQRAWFKSLPVHFVPVDFTLPEDGFEPVDYGLDALWATLETVLPDSVVGLLRGSLQHKELLDFHAKQAHPHIIGYALLNLGVGAIPIVGLPLVVTVQAKLFHSITTLYGLSLTPRLYSEFTTLFGASVGIGLLGRELLGLVPVYGWAVAGAYSGAMTYALGQAFCVYLYGVKRGALPDRGVLKATYDEAFVQARHFLKHRRKP